MLKKLIKLLCLAIAVVLFVACNSTVIMADTSSESFTYDLENNPIAAPQSAQFVTIITGEGMGLNPFVEPADVCNDVDGNIYIVDTGNNRVVVANAYGQYITTIDSFDNNGTAEAFNAPAGVTITKDGDIYICDTGNARVIHLDSEYKLVRIIGAPESPVLGKDFVFKPVKIAVDGLGRIYVVSRNYNAGIIELKKNGEFNQIYGAIEVEYSFKDILKRTFSTKAQKERSLALIPNEYSSVCANDKNFVYACSAYFNSKSTGTGSIKKLNAVGKNILTGVPNEYINLWSKGTYGGPETYVDICFMGDNIYALLDNTRGRIFAYNDEGDMLFEFGGKGDYQGTFGTVSAFTYSNGYFYVTDSKNDCLSIFKLTDYALMFLDAAHYHTLGDYTTENEIWKKIYKLNNNSICAIRNFGRVNYREGNYEDAMKYFKLANDRGSYSEAYEKYRKEIINKHFNLIFISAIVIVILLIAFISYKAKHKKEITDRFSYKATLKYCTTVIFRPISGFWDMKKERYGSTKAALTIFGITTVFYAVFNTLKGFIFTTGVSEPSFVMSLLTVIVPFFMFVICNWCVSSLMDGEGSFKYIFMGTAYSLTPMMFILPVLLILSRFMTMEEAGIYNLIMGIMFLWTLMLVACSNMEVHAYTMGKTVLVLLITLLVMVIVVFLAMLLFALAQEIIGVARDMYNELYLRF